MIDESRLKTALNCLYCFTAPFPSPFFTLVPRAFQSFIVLPPPLSFLSNTSQSAKNDNDVRTYIYLCDAKFDRECPWGGELPSGSDLLRGEPT